MLRCDDEEERGCCLTCCCCCCCCCCSALGAWGTELTVARALLVSACVECAWVGGEEGECVVHGWLNATKRRDAFVLALLRSSSLLLALLFLLCFSDERGVWKGGRQPVRFYNPHQTTTALSHAITHYNYSDNKQLLSHPSHPHLPPFLQHSIEQWAPPPASPEEPTAAEGSPVPSTKAAARAAAVVVAARLGIYSVGLPIAKCW
jgi:phosphatidylglycerophosphate synthase